MSTADSNRKRRAEPISKRTAANGAVSYELRVDVGAKSDGTRDLRRVAGRSPWGQAGHPGGLRHQPQAHATVPWREEAPGGHQGRRRRAGVMDAYRWPTEHETHCAA